jgi:putative membrane protein
VGMERERLLGLARGAVGSIAGLLAMRLVFEAAGALRPHSGSGEEREGPIERRDELDDIALGEIESREDEPATATIGRLAHEAVLGAEPDDARKAKLGQVVHWGYGVLMGGVYGATRPHAGLPDLAAGLGYGTALWALGDELMVPLLGLARGPTAHDWATHATGLGAHLAFGAATATATQALRRVM